MSVASLAGRVALITGADHGSGIGYGIARAFSAAGAKVALLGLRAEVGALAADLDGDALGFRVDVTDRRDVEDAVAETAARLGAPGIVVCNAGIVEPGPFVDLDEQRIERMLRVNVLGTTTVLAVVEPLLGAGSSVITIGSIAAQQGGGLKGGPHYAAAKGAIWALTKSLAREWGPRGIRANTIHPGVIETPMTRDDPPETRRIQLGQIPLGRIGTPQDIGGAALFLASDLAGYVTGQAIAVNGGMYLA